MPESSFISKLRYAQPSVSGRRSMRSRSRGFTLLEVMVALAIIAVGLAAVMTTVTNSVRNTAGLQERTMAHWVAMNKMAELHISKKWPSSKKSRGSMLMADHEWHWEMEIKPTADETKTIWQVIIGVRGSEDDENTITSLTGYISKK